MIRLQISFKLDKDWVEKSDKIIEELQKRGFEFSGSGAGFGQRDIDFEFVKSTPMSYVCQRLNEIYEWLVNELGEENIFLYSVDLIYNWKD